MGNLTLSWKSAKVEGLLRCLLGGADKLSNEGPKPLHASGFQLLGERRSAWGGFMIRSPVLRFPEARTVGPC